MQVGMGGTRQVPDDLTGTLTDDDLTDEGLVDRTRHTMEKAIRDLEQAYEEAAQIEDVITKATSKDASSLIRCADRFLRQAENLYRAGNYAEAANMANASRNLYQAAEALLEAKLGYIIKRFGAERSIQSYFEAPSIAPNEIAKTQSDKNFDRSTNTIASQLMAYAQTLTDVADDIALTDFAYMARNQAAICIARSVRYLVAL